MKRITVTLISLLVVIGTYVPVAAQSISAINPIKTGPATLTTTSSGVCLNTTDCVQLNLGGYTGVSVQVTGTCGTCTLQFEATVDGTNWVALSLIPTNSTTPVTSTTGVGVWQGAVNAGTVRARLSARSSGSFLVSLRATVAFARLTITDSGSAVPGGSDTQVQFNDAGSFGGDSAFVYDKSTHTLTLNTANVTGALTGSSSSIGGGALLAGACASTTVSISGAATSMSVVATPVTYPGDGNFWFGYVSAGGTVTVKVCAAVAGTPTTSVYRVRVIQ